MQTEFDTQLSHKKTQISASGHFNTPRRQGAGYEAVLKSLSIRSPDTKSEVSENTKFNFEPILGQAISGKASIRRFYYNDWPFSDVTIYLQTGKPRAVLKASGKLFHLNLKADVVLAENQLAAQCNVKGRGTSLPSLIACFAQDLSVSMRGKIFLNANFFMQGSDTGQLADSVRGDATAKIDELHIFNLANLDPRLSFFVDFLDAVSMSPQAGEGLSFSTARLRAALSGKQLFIKSFNLNGRLLQAWGGGTYSLGEKYLKLDGRVRSMLGTVNSFNIDRKLKS